MYWDVFRYNLVKQTVARNQNAYFDTARNRVRSGIFVLFLSSLWIVLQRGSNKVLFDIYINNILGR